jgi:Fur family peroxide stress response transcriptional regulator
MDAIIIGREDPIELLETRCREKKLPLTVQRRLVYQNLIRRDDHPTAEQLYAATRESIPGISRATVYRVLETLVEMDLARRVAHAGPAARFDGNLRRHHHLVCSRCSSITDVEDAGLRLRIPAGLSGGDFRIAGYAVSLHGLCKRCRSREGARTAKT